MGRDSLGAVRALRRAHVDDGLLRRRVVRERERHVWEAAPLAWLGNRKVGQIGTLLTWFVPARHAHRVVVSWTGRELVYGATVGVTIGFRQADPLTASERAYFASLSPTVQRALLAAAPVRARA